MIIPLIPPPLIRLNPGDPITSEGVNNILSAVRLIYEALNKPSYTLIISVKNQGNGAPIPEATVSVIPKGKGMELVHNGLYAGSEVKSYVLYQLCPGAYTVVVEAKGFNQGYREISIDDKWDSQVITIEMTAKEGDLFPIPDLFGMPVIKAIDLAKWRGFQVSRIIDTHGKEFSSFNLNKDPQKGALVLNQEPAPGALFPKHSQIHLQISAKAKADELVRVPNLKGLTIEEAEARLKASRLVLGYSSSLELIMEMIYMANTHTKETHSTIHPCAWAEMVSLEHRLFCKVKPEGFRWCDYCFPEKADG